MVNQQQSIKNDEAAETTFRREDIVFDPTRPVQTDWETVLAKAAEKLIMAKKQKDWEGDDNRTREKPLIEAASLFSSKLWGNQRLVSLDLFINNRLIRRTPIRNLFCIETLLL